jgi:hypothetical protein
MRLADFQARFQAAMLDPKNKVTDLDLGIVSRTGDHPQLKLAIHWHHFWSRMEKYVRRHHLIEDYLGPAEYKQLVRDYVAVYPPTSIMASNVSERLREFLATQKPWSETPLLADLANYDWHRAIISASAEELAIRAADLQQIPQTELLGIRLRLKKRATTLKLNYKFHKLNIKQMARDNPPDKDPTYLLLDRFGPKMRLREIDLRTFRAMELLSHGITYGDLMSGLTELSFSPSEIVSHIGAWLLDNLIVAED